jgi:hypothetical protein
MSESQAHDRERTGKDCTSSVVEGGIRDRKDIPPALGTSPVVEGGIRDRKDIPPALGASPVVEGGIRDRKDAALGTPPEEQSSSLLETSKPSTSSISEEQAVPSTEQEHSFTKGRSQYIREGCFICCSSLVPQSAL